MQCPRCREVAVFTEAEAAPEQTGHTTAPAPAQARLDALEARVAGLEKALAGWSAPKHEPAPAPQITWVNEDRPADFSPEQAEALRRNLSALVAGTITIVSSEGNAALLARAEWFREVFESAGWSVQREERAHPAHPVRGLSFASRVPVAPEVAATYLAMRAAGIDLATENDPDLMETEQQLIVG